MRLRLKYSCHIPSSRIYSLMTPILSKLGRKDVSRESRIDWTTRKLSSHNLKPVAQPQQKIITTIIPPCLATLSKWIHNNSSYQWLKTSTQPNKRLLNEVRQVVIHRCSRRLPYQITIMALPLLRKVVKTVPHQQSHRRWILKWSLDRLQVGHHVHSPSASRLHLNSTTAKQSIRAVLIPIARAITSLPQLQVQMILQYQHTLLIKLSVLNSNCRQQCRITIKARLNKISCSNNNQLLKVITRINHRGNNMWGNLRIRAPSLRANCSSLRPRPP